MSSDLKLANGDRVTGRKLKPAGATAPVVARRSVRQFLADAGASRRTQEIAELLVSELVTNVMEHARTTARIAVSIADGVARIEVTDDGPGEPVLREHEHDHGYGLWLVDCLAQSWGVTRQGDHDKTVWLTLPLSGHES